MKISRVTSVVALAGALAVSGPVSGASANNGPDCSVQTPPAGTLDQEEVPEGTDVVECDLVGRPLDLGEATLAIPAAGERVELTADGTDGSDGLSASITTLADGELFYDTDPVGDDQAATTATAAASSVALDGCDDDYIGATKAWELRSAWKFYVGDGGLPAGGTRAQLASAINTAGNSWYTENSPCFSSDGSSAPDSNYAGATTTEADISTSGCKARDSTSTIDAGNLEHGTVAKNCTWYNSNDSVIESDIRFNTGDYNFTYSPKVSDGCSGSFDVLDPLTHEIGHTYGLKDKEAASSYRQTMYFRSFRCSLTARDLGRSDVRHLRSIY